MILPPLLVLTDRSACRTRELVDTVAAAVAGGARAVVLREKDLPPATRIAIGRELWEVLAPVDGTLIVASDVGVADALDCGWIHLAAADARPPAGFAWGRSTHDTGELAHARTEGAAYVTVSPTFVTESKPGYGPALGVAGLRQIVAAAAALPVYALGGITSDNIASCLEAGASGVAVMGAIMRAQDPAALVKELLA